MPYVLRPDGGLTEVADRVWVARHSYLDVNTTVVGGDRGAVVVDTLWSRRAAARVAESVRRLGCGEVVAVANTHHHFDHVLGNAVWRDGRVPAYAHEDAVAAMPGHVEDIRRQVGADRDDEADDLLASGLAVPDHTFSSVAALDLGDRVVELAHLGRGHTAGDVVVRVPDAGVVLAGDLVEESGPPGYGADCFPLDWPATLDLLLQLVGEESVVVPGHGDVVDKAFVTAQRADAGLVAETIFDLAARGVPLEEAVRSASWPWPAERLGEAVRRGYEQLPPTARRLPMA